MSGPRSFRLLQKLAYGRPRKITHVNAWNKSLLGKQPCLSWSYLQEANAASQIRRFSTCGGPQLCLPELTSQKFPHLKRGTFANIEDRDVHFFKELMPGEGRVFSSEDELLGYNMDWLKTVRGASKLVLRPKTTEEVSVVLKYCNERKLAVVPQGGNTGLVGGSVPVFDEIVISTQLMKGIISLDPVSGVLVCQAGCVLEELDNHVAEENLMMPLDLGAKGSCHIGGNVSTNAGGIRLLRYGSLHGSVIGLEVVLADGRIIDSLSTLRKDNTGYDLKQLFIGSEGTLGIVTAVSILCPQKPHSVNLAFLGCENFDRVLQTLRAAKSQLGEVLSAFEFLDHDAMKVCTENLKLKNPLADHPFYVLIETSGSNSDHDEEKLNNFLEKSMEESLVNDGTVANEITKIKNIWGLRERIAEGLLHDGYCYKYDVSLPLDSFYQLVEDMRVRLKDVATRVVGYGHVGDGNLHFNTTAPTYTKEMAGMIEPYLYEWVSERGGSISAEHGLGLAKRNYIHYSKKPEAVELMKQMKQMMDPNGILNPYKTIYLEK